MNYATLGWIGLGLVWNSWPVVLIGLVVTLYLWRKQ